MSDDGKTRNVSVGLLAPLSNCSAHHEADSETSSGHGEVDRTRARPFASGASRPRLNARLGHRFREVAFFRFSSLLDVEMETGRGFLTPAVLPQEGKVSTGESVRSLAQNMATDAPMHLHFSERGINSVAGGSYAQRVAFARCPCHCAPCDEGPSFRSFVIETARCDNSIETDALSSCQAISSHWQSSIVISTHEPRWEGRRGETWANGHR
jgi:hypothetical protein